MAIVGVLLMPKLQGMIIDIGGNGVSDTQILGVQKSIFPLYFRWYVSFILLGTEIMYLETTNLNMSKMKRYRFALDLKDNPNLISEYKKHHENVWSAI